MKDRQATPKGAAGARPGRTRPKRVYGTADVPAWLAGIEGPFPSPFPPAGREQLRAVLLDCALVAMDRILSEMERRVPRPSRTTAPTLIGLLLSITSDELRDHPNHPRGRPCVFVRGRAKEDEQDVQALIKYLRGIPPRTVLLEFDRNLSTDQGFREAVSRPIRLAMRRAYWSSIATGAVTEPV